jgi:excisionase family DNA binding protein
MNASNYLSVEKVAQIFGVSARLIYKQITSGSLPHVRIGKRIVISDTELEKFITKNQHPSQRFDQK